MKSLVKSFEDVLMVASISRDICWAERSSFGSRYSRISSKSSAVPKPRVATSWSALSRRAVSSSVDADAQDVTLSDSAIRFPFERD